MSESGGDSARPGFISNCEVAIHVADLARAEHFYGDVLGFRLVGRTARQLEFDSGVLRLYVNLDSRPLPGFVPSFNVADRAAALEYLEAAGCKPVAVASQPGLHYLRDPFGLLFDVVERPPGGDLP